MHSRRNGTTQATCAICGSSSTTISDQGLPTCREHKKMDVDMKCACGEWLDAKKSKYGVFFVCMNCGPVSYGKGLALNDLPMKRLEDL